MARLGDWDAVWDEVPGVDNIDPGEQTDYAHELFDNAFTFHSEDYEAAGIDPDVVHEMREAFFDFMGLEYEDFPWDEWRQAMGYE